MKDPKIPVVLRIDVEPDDHSPGLQTGWDGFVEMTRIIDTLRERIQQVSGSPLNPTWMVRMDPDIKRCFGRTDYVVDRYPQLFENLAKQGDSLGIHVHAHRWDPQRQVIYSDYADESWLRECMQVSVDSFRNCFRKPVRRASQGGYFLTESLVDLSISLGIEVDLTVEPGLRPKSRDISFGAFATAPSSDYSRFPERPYYPHRNDYAVPASGEADSRPLLLVPLTSYPYENYLKSPLRRMASRVLRGPGRHLPLSMWKEWPSPKVYWDIAMKAASRNHCNYLAFAVRTDGKQSATHLRALQLLDYLPNHPLARRLLFVDPCGAEIRRLAI